MMVHAIKSFTRMLLWQRYILLLVTIAGLLVITAGIGCSDDDTTSSDSLSISDVKFSKTTENTAVITWKTNVPATSTVAYGESSGYLSDTTLDEELVTTHSITLTGLDPDTTYYYEIRSSDDTDNKVASEEETFNLTSSVDVVTVDDIARHPEDFLDNVGVSGIVKDVKEGYFTLGCEDICVVIPVEYSEDMPQAGSDIVVYGKVGTDNNGKYVFQGEKIEIR